MHGNNLWYTCPLAYKCKQKSSRDKADEIHGEVSTDLHKWICDDNSARLQPSPFI